MAFTQHPLWLAGFRPFFALATLAGLSLPLIWALVFTGAMPAPASPVDALRWHAHEMFYGFGWAVLGGFLLTSTKNWVKIRGYHGSALIFLAGAWLFERAGMWFGATWPPALFVVSNALFLTAIVGMLLTHLIRHRANDSYRIDNRYFLIALPLFLPAKFLLLSGDWSQTGEAMTLALFRLAFLIMLERTLSQFMKGVFQVDILRNERLDGSIKALALMMVAMPLIPENHSAPIIEAILAGLLLVRLAFWHPLKALRRIDIGIMHIGHFMISAQLLIAAIEHTGMGNWIGSLSIHTFTFGVMGLIVPAMFVRISKGHTGRKVLFEAADKLILWLMLAAAIVRLLLPQLAPAQYTAFIHAAAGLWFLAFGLLAWRIIPMLLKARVDGKEH